MKILECVPNVSEGRDPAVIQAIARAVRQVSGVHFADIHSDPDHHRSVFTFLGSPEAAESAALALAEAALARIDMRTRHGVHPRLGAVDVVPFVPLRDTTMAEAVTVARQFGRTIAEQFGLPVYFYGEAATRPERRELAEIRRGEYEGLPSKLSDPAWTPDAGPAVFNPQSGAIVVGARRLLIAFNVWLDGNHLDAAHAIARAIRQSSGGLPGVQAIGVRLTRQGAVQVAINLTDYRRTPLKDLLQAVRREARVRGARIAREELVGLAPRDAFSGADPKALGLDIRPEQILEAHLPKAGG